ncbi:MAG: DUF2188 domain-containing protein [Bacteroidia bacterium]
MAKITEGKFWVDLLKKIIKQVLKKQGFKVGPKTHNQHVVPHEEGWAVKGEGNERYSGTYEYQDDAIRRAKRISKNYGSSVVIHRKDGSIRDRVSYKKKD